MKRCKHHRILMYRRKGDAWEYTMTLSGVTLMWQRFFECDRAHCGDCGHQMALAPATDTGPHAAQIAVEVRAAELAANPDSMRGCGETDDINECEQCGVDDYDTGTDPASPAQWAGYLARAIATHQDPTE